MVAFVPLIQQLTLLNVPARRFLLVDWKSETIIYLTFKFNFCIFLTGPNCQTAFNPCFTLEGSPVCQNAGSCTVNLGVSPYYQCACKSGYIGTNCETSVTTSKFTVTTTTPLVCQDQDTPTCEYYAQNNMCSNLYIVKDVSVITYCPKSCLVCTSTGTVQPCVDSQTSCQFWAMTGNCDKLTDPSICRQSCGLC